MEDDINILKMDDSSVLVLVQTTCKISEPYDNPFWEKSNARREKEEKKRR